MIVSQGIELWKARDVCKILKIGRTKLWMLTKSGEFPRPIKTGSSSSIAWRSDEVLTWIETRERA